MAKGTDLASIIPNIKKAIRSALQEDIASYVKEKISEHAVSDVYGAYTPKEYDRRMSLKETGLMDDYMSGELSLTIKPMQTFNEAYHTDNHGEGLPTLIEYGHGGSGYYYDYYFYSDDAYLSPRPYIANTADELNSDGKLSRIISSSIVERL